MMKQLSNGGGSSAGTSSQPQFSNAALSGSMGGAAGSSFNGGSTDAKVSENLQAFYKARDAIYKDLK